MSLETPFKIQKITTSVEDMPSCRRTTKKRSSTKKVIKEDDL